MVAKRPVSARRIRKSSGNSMIEGVFTILPTFALICAFLDFGMALFRWTTLQNAVREGCRYAITFQTGSSGQDTAIRQVVATYAFGMISATDTTHIQIHYYSPVDLTEQSPGNVPGNVVEVSVQGMSWAWMAPFSGSLSWGRSLRTDSPIAISVYSSDIMGGYPAGVSTVTR